MVEREDGSHTSSQEEILNETKTFYEKLYKRRESYESITIHEKLNIHDVPKLSNEESNALEGKITSAEVLNFLKKMKNDKSPGPDGFSCEFFKVFLEGYWNFCYKSNQ